MRTLFVFAILFAFSALLFTAADAGPTPAWDKSRTGSPAYLRASTAAFATPTSGGPQTLGSPPATSVMPNSQPVCSTEALPGIPPVCSVFDITPEQSCSAHCDSQQQCSAFGTNSAPGIITECSVVGRSNGRCSVLQPPVGPAAPSFCSATDGELQSNYCSTFDSVGGKPACTAQNPGGAADFCSARNVIAASAPICSVIRTQLPQRHFCSVGFPGNKTCSTLSFARCSIFPLSGRGICTNLKGAPTGSCSAQSDAGQCSVINVSEGFLCRVP